MEDTILQVKKGGHLFDLGNHEFTNRLKAKGRIGIHLHLIGIRQRVLVIGTQGFNLLVDQKSATSVLCAFDVRLNDNVFDT